MQVHTLELNDFCEEEYSLIGIHTTLEDYKLAYLLNKNLQTRFCKSEKKLDYKKKKNKACFSIYNYSNAMNDFDWYLIANSFRRENLTKSNELLLTTEIKTYLIPEKKKVDFFIKISGFVNDSFIIKTLQKINQIENVITSYSIDKNNLKSKYFLIF